MDLGYPDVLMALMGRMFYLLAETPFEDGTFRLVLTFEDTYPNRPPTVKFM